MDGSYQLAPVTVRRRARHQNWQKKKKILNRNDSFSGELTLADLACGVAAAVAAGRTSFEAGDMGGRVFSAEPAAGWAGTLGLCTIMILSQYSAKLEHQIPSKSIWANLIFFPLVKCMHAYMHVCVCSCACTHTHTLQTDTPYKAYCWRWGSMFN